MFARNVLLLAFSELANVLLPFAAILFLTRTLEPEGLGTYIFAWSATFFLGTVIDWGFAWSAVQEIAWARKDSDQAQRIYVNVLGARLLVTAGCLIVYFGMLLLTPQWQVHWRVFAAMSPALVGAALHP